MAKGHVLVLPMPCQGHVVPLMELSHRLVDHGFEVTFVNTDVDHKLVLAAMAPEGGEALRGIHLASIPDGLADDEDRKDLNKLVDAYPRHMPAYLEALVEEMEAAGRPRVKWLVADFNMGWSLEVAKRLGIRVASFWPASAACLAIMLKIPELIEQGVLHDKGWPEREETLQLAPGMPPLHTSLLPWNNVSASSPILSHGLDLSYYMGRITSCSWAWTEAGDHYTYREMTRGATRLGPDGGFGR